MVMLTDYEVMSNSDKVETDYIAITGYHDGIPIFGPTVKAGDQVSAKFQFDLQDVFYIDVMPYVKSDVI